MKDAQVRQKSYVDGRRRQLEFQVDDKVFPTISPMKGIMWIGKSRNLSTRYVRQFEIIKRVGGVAYQLALPLTLTSNQNVFHVSMLKI